MTKAELMELVGKKVQVYFKDDIGGIHGICGILGYAAEFSPKHDYRKQIIFTLATCHLR